MASRDNYSATSDLNMLLNSGFQDWTMRPKVFGCLEAKSFMLLMVMMMMVMMIIIIVIMESWWCNAGKHVFTPHIPSYPEYGRDTHQAFLFAP